MSFSKHYVLAAGGTGGHMIPAYALAKELVLRGHRVAMITDERGAKIPGMIEEAQVHVLPAGRITKDPRSWVGGTRAILKGRRMAMQLYDTFQPSAVVGFGGYPAYPALLAANSKDIPTIVHEQNAVLGRVNRLASRSVNAIATAYPDVLRIKPKYQEKVHLVGNPVREEVVALRDERYPVLAEDGIFRVLVTGGSQGASILSDVVPDAMAMLPVHLRRRLQITQQCREDDIERVRAKYAEHDIPAELATYLPDLPDRLGWAHLVIGRAGASTIAELTTAGRPAILIPLPSAMDDHQTYNVKEMVAAGGARVIRQPAITTRNFDSGSDDKTNKLRLQQSAALDKMRGAMVKQIQKIALSTGALENAARCARSCGRPEAVSDLADLVESIGTSPLGKTMKAGNAAPQRLTARKEALAKDGVQ
ncbi:undecaprenyldiphospho-muramoylpentapeptide beta-N-acetylglucosaminyltransferase [Sphingorhabdus sp. 109]|jgi:UDP-N-acetylglucosamine--N-acetylmuramyl-(pentapeptide) pyrophosphoryl-undecaprenol N-acetylglucosamine transferase|uniref:undecaprenyldiphospho-muramoylpentapeptide beta-N-acetylglucosaminyltransferase n=1 Tax=Sphingorhabdus sp. 109 TaxID=2653173 RepID=UPI0012F3EF8C|nr:undecaprenyldiphospho-muramoylpentapeptide beta-N-acetylglucosaminyltransferase [Sphingorhabdus sp. 109]VWX58746.1 UDP-N-acetylglucosamine--N-acetylmuramyl-(pentapeptide) pyrophosphoryl-undecaprenol N-acetylglucosamine transferase [Sphingorhabdus sp. 109]